MIVFVFCLFQFSVLVRGFLIYLESGANQIIKSIENRPRHVSVVLQGAVKQLKLSHFVRWQFVITVNIQISNEFHL